MEEIDPQDIVVIDEAGANLAMTSVNQHTNGATKKHLMEPVVNT